MNNSKVKYRPYSKNTEVLGIFINTYKNLSIYGSIIHDILLKHNLDINNPKEWYPLQNHLDAKREIRQTFGDASIFLIGRNVVEQGIWPPQFDTVEKVLFALDEIYHMNHRGDEDIGFINVEKLNDKEFVITFSDPYPIYFDMGLVRGICNKFSSEKITISYEVDDTLDDAQKCHSFKIYLEEFKTPDSVAKWVNDDNALLKAVLDESFRVMNSISEKQKQQLSKQKKIEKELTLAKEEAQKNEHMLLESQKVAHAGSYTMDFKTGYWNSSDTLDEIFGIEASQNREHAEWLDIVHPDDRDMMQKYFTDEVLGKKQRFNKEYRIVRKNDQAVRWVIGFGDMKYDEHGEFLSLYGIIQDVTERKEIEQKLVKTTNMLSKAKEVTKLGIWTHDHLTGKLEWSDEIFELFELDKKTFIPSYERYIDVVYPDDRAKVHEEYMASFDEMREGHVIHRVKLTSGVFCFIELHWDNKFDENGKILSSLGTVYNITEFKTTEQLLNKSQQIAKLGNWELDIAHNNLIWSDEIYNLFGVKPQSFEATYESFLNYVHPEDRELVNNAYKNSLKTQKEYQVRHRILRDDKSVIHVNEIGHSEFDKNNKPIRSFGTVQDVTDSVMYEKEIERIKQELESIIKHIPNILFRCKLDKEWTMIFMNDAVKKITGYSSSDFIENRVLSYESIIHPHDVKMVNDVIMSTINKDERYTVQYRIINSLGDIVWVDESGGKVFDQSGNAFIEGIITDITLNKNLVDKLQKFIDAQQNIVILTDSIKIQFVNQYFLDYFGFDAVESFLNKYKCICDKFIKNNNFFHLGLIKEHEQYWVESLLNLSGRDRIVSMQDRFGEAHAFTVSINKYDPSNYVVNFTDVSDSFMEKLELSNQAFHDQLTHTYNRHYFVTKSDTLIERNLDVHSGTGIIMFDIDHFKKVNDTYGHDVGDAVLVELVTLVKNLIRKSDRLIRWGGEEFIIVLSADNSKEIKQIAQNLRKSIELHDFTAVKSITCSFGASLHKNKEDIHLTIKRADIALYEAKSDGRNQVVTKL